MRLPKPTVPAYPIASVDRALRLIQMLRDRGQLRVRSAAAELEVAESTIHRLLAMLVFRGFAIQMEDRSYVPGPGLGVQLSGIPWTEQLIELAMPHMEGLAERTGETVNLMIRSGTRVYFIWSAQGSTPLHVVPRMGLVLPAARTAGGQVLLAGLEESELAGLYMGPAAAVYGEDLAPEQFEKFLAELQLHGRRGYSTINDSIERGTGALAMPLCDANRRPVAAIGLAVPSARYGTLMEPARFEDMVATRREIERVLSRAPLGGVGATPLS